MGLIKGQQACQALIIQFGVQGAPFADACREGLLFRLQCLLALLLGMSRTRPGRPGHWRLAVVISVLYLGAACWLWYEGRSLAGGRYARPAEDALA